MRTLNSQNRLTEDVSESGLRDGGRAWTLLKPELTVGRPIDLWKILNVQ